MTDQEMNLFCAEALGWSIVEDRNNGWRTVIRPDGSECAEFKLRLYSNEEVFNRYIPDFLHDEAANAMLLDAMPAPELFKHPADGECPDAAWRCRYDWGTELSSYHNDRKTAVVLAFIAFIKAGGKIEN